MTEPPKKAKKAKKEKAIVPTGIAEIDVLQYKTDCTISDYVSAVSAYVRESDSLADGPKKAAQIRLSNALAQALVNDLGAQVTRLGKSQAGECKISGALRVSQSDVTEFDQLDGLRLAVEIKPINLAVGRALWNRFGDIRIFAVNIHLKFPFCVVGGVLVIPTYERVGTKESAKAASEELLDLPQTDQPENTEGPVDEVSPVPPGRRSTIHLIDRAVVRLMRAGGRHTEADAAHLLEAIAVVVYDPDTALLHETLPPVGSGLRWDEFVRTLAETYKSRFEN